MKRKEKQQFYVPSTSSTKYEFLVVDAAAIFLGGLGLGVLIKN